ncbi:hypothetical protein CalGV041 [Clostera anastomosis granulovirus A]|uniref:Uncharacterized protein n=1 Tax=Clostera anastomosis granulovirus A TaxID=1986289 RepID=U5KB89_9BBAC|nr:hypothetical protein CalGV041 [Clostera anastomosis granulovirus Henan]AGQ20300.1 hypothetical protein CalGV041 [Clostera anastomosis granulovirus Henan]
MHEDILTLMKNYNNKYNKLEDTVYELKHQYDKTQYELRVVKGILLEVCAAFAPHGKEQVTKMLDDHDKRFRTKYVDGVVPLANIRFDHQLLSDLGSTYVWNVM